MIIITIFVFIILFWLMLWYIGDLKIDLVYERKQRKIYEDAYNKLYKDTMKWLEQDR